MALRPCQHLDYDGEFTGCTLKSYAPHFPEVRYWERGEMWTDYPGAPVKVQFCKLRGRINGVLGCYNGEMPCYSPLAEDES